MIEYKVVEVSTVTDEEIQKTINSKVREGWSLDGMHFAMRDSSKRPSMAFILFTRESG
jgi:type 1 glutamine amidotransferase